MKKRPQHESKPGRVSALQPALRQAIHYSWQKDFQQLLAYRRHNPNKWPSRDSKNPTEIRMANWIRSNLELLAANRLAPAQMRMIKDLVSGAQRTTQNSK